jgi:16S rRNA processing protein RimM
LAGDVTPEAAPGGLIPFALVGRPHGLSGEVILRPFNDDAADLSEAPLPLTVRLVLDGSERPLTLVHVRPAGRGLLARFEGVANRDDAATLTNGELWVPRDWLPAPDEDEFYVEDLIGCQVVDTAGQPRGTVRASFWNGAQDVLTVEGPGGEELLVPAVPEFVLEVDLEARRVVVDPHE